MWEWYNEYFYLLFFFFGRFFIGYLIICFEVNMGNMDPYVLPKNGQDTPGISY
jgi:hypothetical protein